MLKGFENGFRPATVNLPVIYYSIDITLYIIRRFVHELPIIYYREMPTEMSLHLTFHLTLALSGLGAPTAVCLVDDALRVG